MSNISRRQFLKGAGVATLAVAAAGVLAGCSKEDVPVIPEVTTRPVMVIFMADKGNGETVVVGETAKIDVLKTEDSVKVADIDKKLLPEGYELENEKAEVEIRNDATKGGEYIIVFVTDVTYASKEVEVKLHVTNPTLGEDPQKIVKVTVAKDATTIRIGQIKLPEGYEFVPGAYEADVDYHISADMQFAIQHV